MLTQMINAGLIQRGNFILKSGKSSNVYFDFKGLVSHPDILIDIGTELNKLIIDRENKVIIGVPMGGIVYATVLSIISKIPLVILRPEQKDYGMKRQIEGDLTGKEVILVEDVITTGQSVLETLKTLQSKVSQILCIMDREEGGITAIKNCGYNVSSLFKLSDVGSIQSRLIKKIILSIDKEIDMNILTPLFEYVSAIKIHSDILSDQYIRELMIQKKRYQFIVIDDRKFADIPYISKKQLENILKKWDIDIITVHGMCGEELVRELNFPTLLIARMSNKGNLINYSETVYEIGRKYDHVIGYIDQYRAPNKLTFTPGIGLGKDHKQLKEIDADYYIIGRAILDAENPLETIIEMSKK
jgi:orotate phosphoribosyltransferase